jgi:hypothetical protein
MDNMISNNLDQHSYGGSIQQLHVLIKKLKYHDIMDVEYLLNYSRKIQGNFRIV